jgi:valyl-tRNA synthetase
LQSFFWDDYCAYYLEISKPFLYGKIGSHEQVSTKKWILLYTLTSFIQLLHPIAPFITEELFSILKELVNKVYFPEHPLSKELKATFNQSMCGLTQLPSWTFFDHNALALMEEFKQTLYVIRNIRGESNISPGEKLFIEIEEKNSPLKERVDILHALTKIHSIEFYQTFDEPLFPVSIVQMKSRKIRIKIPHELLAREKVRLSKSLVEIQKNLEVTSKQLSNKEFVERAPKELIEEKRNLLEVLEKSKQEIESKLLALS